jgi:hypothetical protein
MASSPGGVPVSGVPGVSVPVPVVVATTVQKDDIYLVFDKDNNRTLKAMGKMHDNTTIGERVNDVVVDTRNKDEKEVLIEKFAANTSSVFNIEESVVVKLEDGGNFLYIPGFVVDVDSSAGLYKIGVETGRTITAVPKENIRHNRKLKSGEKGWFFSDIILGQVVKNKGDQKEMNYDTYRKGIPAIITGSGIIDITGENGDKYTHNTFKIKNGKDIPPNTVKFKSVVPLRFNAAHGVSGELTPSPAITVFGGKKSRKQKTRKNTMPLQFAPGAKRSYLKRRKSSRK